MDVTIRRATERRQMRWANNGGWTTEIAAFPSADDWAWRLSIADVATDGPFSCLAGIDRTIALLDGTGFALTIDGTEHVVDRRFAPLHFDGASTTDCRLLDGPVQDLNLMVRRGSLDLELRFVTLQPADQIELAAELVLVVAGSISITDVALGRFDAALLNSPAVVVSASHQETAVIAVVARPGHPNTMRSGRPS